jgi:hypothetical protein
MMVEPIRFGVHKMFKIIHNTETGEIEQLDLSDAELIAWQKATKENEKRLADLAQKEAERIAQKNTLLQKLGITENEAKLLLS